MMKHRMDWIPPVRHKRSQNAGVLYTLVDEVMAVVDALMRISLRTERWNSEAPCWAELQTGWRRSLWGRFWRDILGPVLWQVNENTQGGTRPNNLLAMNRYDNSVTVPRHVRRQQRALALPVQARWKPTPSRSASRQYPRRERGWVCQAISPPVAAIRAIAEEI
jgi:hypothetical protein